MTCVAGGGEDVRFGHVQATIKLRRLGSED